MGSARLSSFHPVPLLLWSLRFPGFVHNSDARAFSDTLIQYRFMPISPTTSYRQGLPAKMNLPFLRIFHSSASFLATTTSSSAQFLASPLHFLLFSLCSRQLPPLPTLHRAVSFQLCHSFQIHSQVVPCILHRRTGKGWTGNLFEHK
jgi:hypothetical protein